MASWDAAFSALVAGEPFSAVSAECLASASHDLPVFIAAKVTAETLLIVQTKTKAM